MSTEMLLAFIAGLATGGFIILFGTILGYRLAQLHERQTVEAYPVTPVTAGRWDPEYRDRGTAAQSLRKAA